jgi:hypothetical protein
MCSAGQGDIREAGSLLGSLTGGLNISPSALSVLQYRLCISSTIDCQVFDCFHIVCNPCPARRPSFCTAPPFAKPWLSVPLEQSSASLLSKQRNEHDEHILTTSQYLINYQIPVRPAANQDGIHPSPSTPKLHNRQQEQARRSPSHPRRRHRTAVPKCRLGRNPRNRRRSHKRQGTKSC